MPANVLRRLATRLRRRGVRGLAPALARRVAAAQAEAEDARFDRRRQTDTAGVIRLRPDSPTATNYQPVHPRAFRDFLDHLPPDRGRLTLVDYGSGRGRAVMLAIEHGFGAAVGIELEPAHHAVAVANLARHEARRGRRAAIELVLADARGVPLPPGPVVAFLYNPFERDVMQQVLAEMAASLRAEPRELWLIYEAPFHRDLIDANPLFELVAERTESAGASPRSPRFAIYRART